MKILHISTAHGWRGGEQQLFYLACGLQGKGGENIIAAQPGSPLHEKAADAGIASEEFSSRGEFSISAYFTLAKIIKKHRPDIIHAHDGHAVTYAAFASIISHTKAKKIATRRVDFKVNSSWKYNLNMDRVVCISDAIRQVCADSGIREQKLLTVHSGIDPDRLQGDYVLKEIRKELGLERKNKVLLNVASLTDHKGQCYLLEAILEIAREIDDTRLLIVGEGELENELKLQVQELALEDKVMFLGFRNDIGILLNLCDLFVMSSHLEGLCTSVLDAMANERAVVISDAGGLPETVGNSEAGVVVEAKNSDAFADAAIKLLKDASLREKMGKIGRARILEKFSVENMINGNYKIYQELLNV